MSLKKNLQKNMVSVWLVETMSPLLELTPLLKKYGEDKALAVLLFPLMVMRLNPLVKNKEPMRLYLSA